MGECVVCSKSTSGSLQFCEVDYKRHKKAILDKKPWVRALKNEASREKRRKKREYADTSLDEIEDYKYEPQY